MSSQCLVAIETKNYILNVKMKISKFHLSNGLGVQKNDKKDTKLQMKKMCDFV